MSPSSRPPAASFASLINILPPLWTMKPEASQAQEVCTQQSGKVLTLKCKTRVLWLQKSHLISRQRKSPSRTGLGRNFIMTSLLWFNVLWIPRMSDFISDKCKHSMLTESSKTNSSTALSWSRVDTFPDALVRKGSESQEWPEQTLYLEFRGNKKIILL